MSVTWASDSGAAPPTAAAKSRAVENSIRALAVDFMLMPLLSVIIRRTRECRPLLLQVGKMESFQGPLEREGRFVKIGIRDR